MEDDEGEVQCRMRWFADLMRRLAKYTDVFERICPMMEVGLHMAQCQTTAATHRQWNMGVDGHMVVNATEMCWTRENGVLEGETQFPLSSLGHPQMPLEEEPVELFHVIQTLLRGMDLKILSHKRDLKLLKTAQIVVQRAIRRPKWMREFYFSLVQQKNDKTDVALLLALWSVVALVIYIFPCPWDLQTKVLDYMDSTWKEGIPEPLFALVTGIRNDIMYTSSTLDRGKMNWFCTEEFDSCRVLLPDRRHQDILYCSLTSVSDVLEQMAERCELGREASSKLILMKGEPSSVMSSRDLVSNILKADIRSDDSAPATLLVKRFFGGDATVGNTKLVLWSFIQARAEYLTGWYPVSDETAVQLAILLLRYSLPLSIFDNRTQLIDHLPRFMPNQCAEKWKAAQEDAGDMPDFQTVKRMSMQEIRLEFLRVMESLDDGLCLFFSPQSIRLLSLDRSLEENTILGVNGRGLHIFADCPYRHLVSVTMESIISCTSHENILSIGGRDPNLPCVVEMEPEGQKLLYEVLLHHKGDLQSISPVQSEEDSGTEEILMNGDTEQALLRVDISRSCPLMDKNAYDLSPIAERMKKPAVCSSSQAEDEEKSEDVVEMEKTETESEVSTVESTTVATQAPRIKHSLSHNHVHFEPSSSKSYQNVSEYQEDLRAGSIFAEKYIIQDDRRELDNSFEFHAKSFQYVWEMQSSSRPGRNVVLKFYKSTYHFQTSKVLSDHLASKYFAERLDIIELDGFLPCMVFERGDMTLDEWKEKPVRDIVARRNVVHQILKCLDTLHKMNAVHCDIEFNSIEWFETAHCWKLVNVDRAVDDGRPGKRQPPLQTMAPEWYQAIKNGDSEFVVTPAADMWSFGIVAYEILTGKNFFGMHPSDAYIEDCLAGRRQLPSCAGLDTKTDVVYVKELIKMDPASRGSAEDCLQFLGHSGPPSILKRHQQDMKELLNEIKDIVQKSHNEQMGAHLGVDVRFQEFCSEQDILQPFDKRKANDALTAVDDNLESPIFLLNVGRDYRLRIRLWHKYTSTHHYIIKQIKIQAMDEEPDEAVELEMRHVDTEEHVDMVYALFLPERQNSAKLFKPSPQFGDLIEKYLNLKIHIVVGRPDSFEEDVDLKSVLMCSMFASENRLAFQKWAYVCRKKYFEAPQWIRDSSGGVVILGKALMVGAAGMAMGSPTMFGRAMLYLCSIFTLDCARKNGQS